MNKSDIDYIIEKLESYKPDNIYNGYNSEREKRDQRVSEVLDSIIAEIKIEPVEESKWIKCSEEMPEPMRQVLFYDEHFKDCAAGYYNKNYNAIQVGCALLEINGEYERFTHWMPIPELPKGER